MAARALGADAARDEALDPAGGVGDTEGGVFGTDESPDSIDDELEDGLEIEDLGDDARGVDQRFEFVDTERRRGSV